MSEWGDDAAGRLLFADDGWTVTLSGDDPQREGWAGTLLALSNGAIGIRGLIEERACATTFLAHGYETAPIHYHERLHGFAEQTDSRVPVVETLGMAVHIDGAAVDFEGATSATERALDLRTGVLHRRTEWSLADGRTLTVEAERIVPLDGRTLLIRRMRARASVGNVTLHPRLHPAPRPAGQSDDPRIGVELGAGFVTERADTDAVAERLSGSGRAVAAVQRVRDTDGWLSVATGLAVGTGATDALLAEAATLADEAIDAGFAGARAAQAALLAPLWETAAIAIDDDPRLTAALRLNLFHLFASAGRDGQSSAAAKGLTGEGYEGHYFWDAEVFMLPVLAVLAPQIARAMLLYRAHTLDAAFANARALDHAAGALYAWRTIGGRECSAHYPSGSAQYHINAAIAFAIRCYVEATGDEAFLVEHGARMLVETARLWLALGDWQDGAFHLRGVTGPDEYTALVDDNWYTNRMAQAHLRYAADVAERLAGPASIGLAITADELAAFRRAADAMALPFDARLGIDAQDASFLGKPRWDLAATPRDRFPLLLHYHPMTLYRHQVAKQADLILGLVLAGQDIPADRKRRAYDHYEPITTHDSTLSAATFATLAAEVGYDQAAVALMHDAAFVDIDDRHRNTGHGVHMAAMAGSWQALVWGFGGFRPGSTELSFRPTRPRAWAGYRFGLLWRGTRVEVSVEGEEVTYTASAGPAITLRHHGRTITLDPGESWTGPIAS